MDTKHSITPKGRRSKLDLKSEAIRVRIKQSEREDFIKKLKGLYGDDFNYSKWIVKAIREFTYGTPYLLKEEHGDFRDALKQLSGMARNLNQIARAANAGKVDLKFSDRLLESVSEQIGIVLERIKTIIYDSNNRSSKSGAGDL